MKKLIFIVLSFLVFQKGHIKGMEDKGSPDTATIEDQLYSLLYGVICTGQKEVISKNIRQARQIVEKNCTVLPGLPLDRAGRTPLHFAAEYSDDLLCVWLKNYPKRDLIDDDGNTLMHVSAEKGSHLCIPILFFANVPIDVRNIYGFAPLHYAVLGTKIEVLQKLLFYGANPNITNSLGDTPLHCSLNSVTSDYMQILLTCKGDPWIRNNANKTVIDLVVEKYKHQLIQRDNYKKCTKSQQPLKVHSKKLLDEVNLKFICELGKSKNFCILLGDIDTSGRCKELLKKGDDSMRVIKRTESKSLLENGS